MMKIQGKMIGIRLDGDTRRFLIKALFFVVSILMVAFTLMSAISD